MPSQAAWPPLFSVADAAVKAASGDGAAGTAESATAVKKAGDKPAAKAKKVGKAK